MTRFKGIATKNSSFLRGGAAERVATMTRFKGIATICTADDFIFIVKSTSCNDDPI